MTQILPALPGVRECTFSLVSNSKRFVSPLTRLGQTVGRVGDFWAATLSTPPLTSAQAREWAALQANLSGGRDSVYVGPPIVQSDVTIPVLSVYEAGQVGTSLRLTGAANGYELPAGLWFSIDIGALRLLHVTRFASTKSAGLPYLAIDIAPALRVSPALGAALDFATPTCEMISVRESEPLLDLSQAHLYGLSLALTEKLW